ncbi:TMEM266 [Branchiostoma lanceolatum]|uniref:TMEM266 protein n=1 Tax=Branchiostoma lanceolatum TaxID=7740 RepID=A0A8J9ZIL2_BRALA|nr:TMEM266 [Branchiostoma lanceolatum]
MPRFKGQQQNNETCRQMALEKAMVADELGLGMSSADMYSGNVDDDFLDFEAAIFSDNEEERTCKQRVVQLLDGPATQITIVVTSWLLSHALLVELLVDTSVIHFNHDKMVARIIHWVGLGVLSVFTVEVLDLALVVTACVPMIVVSAELATSTAYDGFSLVIILRMWRCYRVVQGYVSPVREEASKKVHVLLQAQRRANQELQTLYLMHDENQEEIHRLRFLLGRREAEEDNVSQQLQMALEREDSQYVAQLISTIEQRQAKNGGRQRDGGRDSPNSTIVVHAHRLSDSNDVPSGTIASRLSESTTGDSGICDETRPQQQTDDESRNHTNFSSCAQVSDCKQQTLAVVEARENHQRHNNRSPGCNSKRNPAVSSCDMDRIDVIGSEIILQHRSDSMGKNSKFLNGKLPSNKDSRLLFRDNKSIPSNGKVSHNKNKVCEIKVNKALVKDHKEVDDRSVSKNTASPQTNGKIRKGKKKADRGDTYVNGALLLEMTELQQKGDAGYCNEIVLEQFYQNGNAPATAL